MPWIEVHPVVNYRVRGLCAAAYPGHPRGCPNVGKKSTCPPLAPRIESELDLSRTVLAIYNVFDFAGHVNRMRGAHPGWSERQLANCLYWQPGARKHLRAEIVACLREHRGLHIAGTPEAMGVDLTATMAGVGIDLEWPPRTVAYQIVLAGYRHARHSS